MRAPRLLVTGFGPFPGVPDNPTARLVESIEAAGLPGVTTTLLPTEWEVCGRLTGLAGGFDAVLMFGVAARAYRIRYERVAHAVAGKHPDAAGARAAEAAPPVRYRTTRYPVPRLVAAARTAGFPVVTSHSAGTYICNAAYGAALAANPFSLFVHVPLPRPRGPLSQDGLTRHAFWLLDHLRTSM